MPHQTPNEPGAPPPQSAKEIVLERTGAPPIKFKGELLVEGTTITEKKDDRGYRITIYTTCRPTGDVRYVMHVQYVTHWKAEANGSTVYVADTGREVAIKLFSYNPMYFVIGYPPDERFNEKRRRLHTTLTRQYMALASRLLLSVPEAHLEPGIPFETYGSDTTT